MKFTPLKSSSLFLLIIFFVTFSCKNPAERLIDYSLIPVKTGEKWGYVDKEGKYIINPQFKHAFLFSDGLARVEADNDKILFIDKSGKYIINEDYTNGTIFSEGLVFVVGENSYPKCLNKKGDVEFELSDVDGVSCFSEGLAIVNKDDQFGYIDHNGNYVIPVQFDRVGFFNEGLALVGVKDKDDKVKFGYIDPKGKYVINPQFDDGFNFKDGLAVVVMNEKYGYINNKGTYEINPQFEDASDFSEGLALIKQGDNYGYIDKTGTIVINPQFEFAGPFKDGKAVVSLDGETYGYIDKKGKIIVNPQFDYANNYYDQLAVVKNGDRFGLINTEGKFAINPQFDAIQQPYSPYFRYLLSTYYNYDSVGISLLESSGKMVFLSFYGDLTIKDVVNNNQYLNVLEFDPSTDYKLIHKNDITLNKDISLTDIKLTFNQKVITYVPEYWYGYEIGKKEVLNYSAKLASLEYNFKVDYSANAFGKNELLAKNIKNYIQEKYANSTLKEEEGLTTITTDHIRFVIITNDSGVSMKVYFEDASEAKDADDMNT